MAPNLSLFSVHAILLLSTDDRSRILTKYYRPPHHQATKNDHQPTDLNPYPTLKEQKAFEKGLLEKTNKNTGDIILYDGRVVCYKMEGDVMLYVVGGAEENEVLLFGVVLALRDALAILLKWVSLRFPCSQLPTSCLWASLYGRCTCIVYTIVVGVQNFSFVGQKC